MRLFGLEIRRRRRQADAPVAMQTGGGVFRFSPRMTTGEMMANSTVNACVNIIADAVSSLSCNVYRRSGAGREKDTSCPLAVLLKRRPNPCDTHSSFFQQVMLHLLLKGNAFIYVERGGFSGEARSLWAVDPDTVEIRRRDDGSPFYVVTTDHGVFQYTSDNMLHIPAIRYNRLRGLSPLEYSAHSARTGLRLEEYTMDYFDKGIHSKFMVGVSARSLGKSSLTRDDKAEISDMFLNAYGGRDNASRPLVYNSDASKPEPISWPENREAQLVENRAFTEKEIAKIFRVPLFMLGSENSKFTNMEQANTNFLQHTLTPWLVRIQEHLTLLLPGPDEYVEFDTNTMLRADYATRWGNYRENFKNGLFTLNQIMDAENMPRVAPEIGDKHFMQAQYSALEDGNADRPGGDGGSKEKGAENDGGKPFQTSED